MLSNFHVLIFTGAFLQKFHEKYTLLATKVGLQYSKLIDRDW